MSEVGDATHSSSRFLIEFKTADGQWHEPTTLQMTNGLGISAAINGGNVEASAIKESGQVPSLRWNSHFMQMTCDAVANASSIKITLHNTAAIVAKVLLGGPREDILVVDARYEDKFAEVTVINHHTDNNKNVAYQGSTHAPSRPPISNKYALTVPPLQGLANKVVQYANGSFVRAKTSLEELSNTKQEDTNADAMYAEYKVTAENLHARSFSFTNAKAEVGGFKKRFVHQVHYFQVHYF